MLIYDFDQKKQNGGIISQFLEPSIRIYHQMSYFQLLSNHFLEDLYLSKPSQCSQPVFQILGFESSEHNPKEIILRLSDGGTFFDATLVGPYELAGNKITVSPFSAYHGTNQFKKYDIVKVVDFFSKVDLAKICRLKMMIRKIVEAKSFSQKIGRPQQLAMFMTFNYPDTQEEVNRSQPPPDPIDRIVEERQTFIIPQPEIKICQEQQPKRQPPLRQLDEKKIGEINKELQILGIVKDRNPDEPLTYRDIMNGYDGFFIGRLLRIKLTHAEGKDGSIPKISLGFLDSAGQMLRFNLLGKMAVREQKQLKKGKCYYLKGLQVVQTKGNSYIKLRQKDYKLHILNEQTITSKFEEQYYHWEHQYDYVESENVDVIGVVDDIEQKASYGIKTIGDTKQSKEVIRVVIRNRFKTVKVSFWSDQLKNLLKYNLKKGDIIMIEDVRKKKFVFLDYSVESTLTKIDPGCQVYNKLQSLLPQKVAYAKPTSIKCLYAIQQVDKFNTKLHTIYGYLSKICEEKMIFKYCDFCKKKINMISAKCFECKNSVISIKYNTNLQFADFSGSITVSVFDNVAERFFGVSALQMKDLREKDEEEYEKNIDKLGYSTYVLGIQIKSERFILRTIEITKDADINAWNKQTLKEISEMLKDPTLNQQCWNVKINEKIDL